VCTIFFSELDGALLLSHYMVCGSYAYSSRRQVLRLFLFMRVLFSTHCCCGSCYMCRTPYTCSRKQKLALRKSLQGHVPVEPKGESYGVLACRKSIAAWCVPISSPSLPRLSGSVVEDCKYDFCDSLKV